jgi:hypothetical protein
LRLLGVGVSGFDERSFQLGLFDAEMNGDGDRRRSAEERGRLVRGIDAVRERFGDFAIRRGRELKTPQEGSAYDAADEARSRPRDD